MSKKKRNGKKRQVAAVSSGLAMATLMAEMQRELTIKEAWEENREKFRSRTEKKLTFMYKTEDQLALKEVLVPALALWKFVRCHVGDQFVYFGKRGDGHEKRKEFLRSFLADDNRYVRLVVMIELLPIAIWRRILWRANIDFVSHESFLRRLQPEHWLAIEANFVDLENRQQPRILTAKERKYPELQIERLLDTSTDIPHLRHDSKAAWTKNLFDFDFGFRCYPDGENNDRMVLATDDRRRMHTNDVTQKEFVVDEEFGRYMRLYTQVRSDYVFHRGAKVKLKDHICPGYWITMIALFVFFYLSPTMAIGLAVTASWNHLPWWANVLLGIPAAVTPFWLVCAGLKFSWIGANRLVDNCADKWAKKVVEWIGRLCDEHPRAAKWTLGVILSLIFGIAIALAFFAVLRFRWYDATLAGVAMAGIIGYEFSRAGKAEQPMPLHMFIPLYSTCLYLGGLLAVRWSPYLVKGLATLTTEWLPRAWRGSCELVAWLWIITSAFVSKFALEYVVPIFKFVLLGAASVGSLWLVVLVPLSLIGLLCFAYFRLSKEAQIRLDYLIDKASIGGVFVIVAAILVTIRRSDLPVELFVGVMLIGAVSVLVAFATMALARFINPEVKQLKNESLVIQTRVRRQGLFDYRQLAASSWLKSLPLATKAELAQKVDRFVVDAIPYRQEGKAVALIMRRLGSLEDLERIIANHWSFCDIDSDSRLPIVKIMLSQQVNFKEARRLYLAQRERVRKNVEATETLLKVLFAPVYFFWVLLQCIARKIRGGAQHVLDFRRMAKAIRDICPYIVKSENLN